MKSRLVVLIGTTVLIVVLALQSCAVSSTPPSQMLATSPRLSPLVPTLSALSAPSPLPTPTRTAKLALDFSLPRESGQTVRLSDFRDKSSVVLVFYRGQT